MNEEEKNEFEKAFEENKAAEKTAKEAEKKPPFGKRVAASLYDFTEMIGAITVVIILCFSFVVRLNVVDGPSMENTLHTGEYLVVSDLFYKPTQGDIVVLQSPEAAENYRKPLVKRVIATEGQTLDIDTETGKVTVDGVELDETYVNLPGAPSKMYGDHMTFESGHAVITVTEDHVFVMGDNRNNSADSRLSGIGLVDERCIVGKVLLRIFPFNKITAFSNPFDGK
ncbi:MAG: signal peptidase I [Clostridia bacterium]|nr:signal peptidase I [Clostridia bacterium]